MKYVIIDSTCPQCAGKQFIAKGHLTRKRNRVICPTCLGNGDVKKKITQPS